MVIAPAKTLRVVDKHGNSGRAKLCQPRQTEIFVILHGRRTTFRFVAQSTKSFADFVFDLFKLCQSMI
jgi:hypothetical protein